jgi:WbqC-like protein family
LSRLVAVHQPNFLPWLGYFDKLARADIFVILDDAQFPKKQGSWINRVRLRLSGRPAFLTVPVVRAYSGVRSIRQIQIDDTQPWRTKASKSIEFSYRRAPHFEEIYPLVEALLSTQTESLAGYNERGIRALASGLGLDTEKLVRSSDLGVTTTATQRLVDLTRAVGGTAYLSGDGASDYQDDQLFARSGIELFFQEFVSPRYAPPGEAHVPGLSILDALMTSGWATTADMIGVGVDERSKGTEDDRVA